MSDYPHLPLAAIIARGLRVLFEVALVSAILGGLIVIPGLAPAAFAFLVLFGVMVYFKTSKRH